MKWHSDELHRRRTTGQRQSMEYPKSLGNAQEKKNARTNESKKQKVKEQNTSAGVCTSARFAKTTNFEDIGSLQQTVFCINRCPVSDVFLMIGCNSFFTLLCWFSPFLPFDAPDPARGTTSRTDQRPFFAFSSLFPSMSYFGQQTAIGPVRTFDEECKRKLFSLNRECTLPTNP